MEVVPVHLQQAFDPDKWLQLGIAGGSLLVLLMVVGLFIRSMNENSRHWAETVNLIAERFDNTAQDTNSILRELSVVMARVDVKIPERRKSR